MSMIYAPKGKAREYSPFALNVYLQCSHGCKYCYAPAVRRQSYEQYLGKAEPRKDIAAKLKKELSIGAVPKEQVLLSFIGDIYSETADDGKAARECLEVLLEKKVPVAILTKGGKRCLRDLELYKRFGEHIQVGASLVFEDLADSLAWEPGAAPPEERLEALRVLHEEGVKTFASFEPVIDPEQSIKLMQRGMAYIDVYKVGKLNHMKEIESRIDWADFLLRVVQLLRDAKKPFYIKHDLRRAAPEVRLYGNEVLADEYSVI